MKNNPKQAKYPVEVAAGRTGRLKKRAKTVRVLIIVLTVFILCLLFLTLALPHFLVKEISVKGADRYDETKLVELSGIQIGEEILTVNLDSAVDAILANCPYVRSVSVTVHLSGKVVLNVTEEKAPMYAKEDGLFVSFSDSFTVLEVKETAEGFSGFLFVELPVMTSLRAGGRVKFRAEDEWAKKTLLTLRERLLHGSYADKLTEISVQKEREIFYVLNGNCKIILGEVKELDEKDNLLAELLKQRGGLPTEPITIDLSNPKKIIVTSGN